MKKSISPEARRAYTSRRNLRVKEVLQVKAGP
jgi:hypothetical protein